MPVGTDVLPTRTPASPESSVISQSDAKKTAAMLAGVAEPTRMRLIEQLVPGPQSVGNLAEAIGAEIVNVSHHLGVLRAAGLVANEKAGRHVIYRLAEDVFTPDGGGGTFALGGYRLAMAKASKPAKAAKKK